MSLVLPLLLAALPATTPQLPTRALQPPAPAAPAMLEKCLNSAAKTDKIRQKLRKNPYLLIKEALYDKLYSSIRQDDRDWILKALKNAAKDPDDINPAVDYSYWLATDWLICFGLPKDWSEFEQICNSKTWQQSIAALSQELQSCPTYWEQPKAPLPPLVNSDKTDFPAKVKRRPSPPHYPQGALSLKVMSTIVLDQVIGVDGKAQWMRPRPGYALAFFAPVAMKYAAQWEYEITNTDGTAHPTRFTLTMPFKLSH